MLALAMPRDRLGLRTGRCVLGLTLFGVGIAFIVRGDLGLGPWDVFHQGLSEQTDLGIGVIIVIVSLALLPLWIPLRERPGLGTLLNAIQIGIVVDLVLLVFPETDRLVPRATMMLGGIVLIAVGSGYYIGAGLGPGPRDGLMTGLARMGLSIRLARTLVELSALTAGVLLGGTVGVGTVLFALGIGPLVQFFLPRLRVGDPPEAPRTPLSKATT